MITVILCVVAFYAASFLVYPFTFAYLEWGVKPWDMTWEAFRAIVKTSKWKHGIWVLPLVIPATIIVIFMEVFDGTR